ncbi:unnamed protein product [Adineta ricciae]|uniref:Uncharacterized protein n=1 Tax=Adineta ricciae TaxID=249248 RepID=A0A813R355_ADIRI|nr:unnamed protein product [Adineta ricciae]CAF1003279.1 unnamed protein product [Adineta ricciae]
MSRIYLLLFLNIILPAAAITLQDQIDQLSKIDQENIVHALLPFSSSRNAIATIDVNWCCRIDPGVEATSYTRQTTYYVVKHGRHKCGYDGCGFLGWSRCTRWCEETWTEVQHGVETYLVYKQRVCPQEQLTCCAQHIYVLGHCFSYEEIYNNQQLLAQLNELGIVIPGPSVG